MSNTVNFNDFKNDEVEKEPTGKYEYYFKIDDDKPVLLGTAETLTIKLEGDKLMSKGDVGREVEPTSYYVICSLEEIPEYIESIKNPFWIPESGTSNEDILNYPFEKKRWGRNTNVVIEPLSKELEESYLDGCKKGFFETWRGIREMEEEEKRKVI